MTERMMESAMAKVEVSGAPVRYDLAPANLRGSLERYIEHGIPPGSFLEAFLGNDLMGAMGRADDINSAQFVKIAQWLYNYAPRGCYGSADAVRGWMRERQEARRGVWPRMRAE